MNFKDYFDVDIAIDPEFFKLTSTLLGGTLDKDYLYANSEEYSRFLGEHIWKPVATKIGISNLKDVAFSCLISIDNEVVGDKHLSSRKMNFTLPNYLFAFLYKFGFKADELKEAMNKQGYEDILRATKVAIRVKRLKFTNIVKEGKASEYYAEIKNEFGKSDNEMIEFAQEQEKNLILIATRIMNLLPIFEKSPDIKQIKSCFEYDTFCLIIAKSILDTDHLQMLKQGVDADFIYIERYLKAIKQYRIQNPDYNCVINIRDTKTGQVTQYSIDDFEKEYQQYLSRFPHKMPRYTTEFEFRGILRQAGYPELESFEPKNPASVSKAEAFLKKWFDLKTLSKSWKVFPKGTRTELGDSVSSIDITKVPLTEQEKTRRMLISYQYLESSDYLFKIEGINEFEGYIGYVYKSGKVVLEKFYDNFNTRKVVTNCATYIIKDFNKLVAISMLSKTEIMKGMREGELKGEVSREFHYSDMERWKSKIDQDIIGDDYTEAIIEYIDSLIKQGKIQQRATSLK